MPKNGPEAPETTERTTEDQSTHPEKGRTRPRPSKGRVIKCFLRGRYLGTVRFDGATFTGNAGFRAATFSGHARFSRVVFKDGAWFSRVVFNDGVSFYKATFSWLAGFRGTTFNSGARFEGATFVEYDSVDALGVDAVAAKKLFEGALFGPEQQEDDGGKDVSSV